MRFVLFTEKTTSQCMKSLNERLQIKGTRSRPALDGWIEKNGRFMLTLTTPVWGKFTRTTRLRASASREDGRTVIRGTVPEGVSKDRMIIILAAIGLLAIYLFVQGNLVAALLAVLLGAALIVPLWGDHKNHDRLLYELERALDAKPAPRNISTKSTSRSSSRARTTSARKK